MANTALPNRTFFTDAVSYDHHMLDMFVAVQLFVKLHQFVMLSTPWRINYRQDIHRDGLVRQTGLIRGLSTHTHTHSYRGRGVCRGSKFRK
jgi:hypothetical protein